MVFKRFVLLLLLPLYFHANAQNADLRLLKFINTPVQPADRTWRLVSGSITFSSVAAPAAIIATGLAKHDHELTEKGIVTVGALAIDGLATLGMKTIIRRQRPFVSYPDMITVKTGAGGYSFPSGHTSLAFATATSVSMAFPNWYVIVPSFTYASLVGYSRIYLGVHYPSDVLAGALVGAGSAYFSSRAQHWFDRSTAKRHHGRIRPDVIMN